MVIRVRDGVNGKWLFIDQAALYLGAAAIASTRLMLSIRRLLRLRGNRMNEAAVLGVLGCLKLLGGGVLGVVNFQ